MKRQIRVALSETINVYPDMPQSVDTLDELDGRLEALRDANIEHHVKLAQMAAKQGVEAICFGELFTGPYFALEKKSIWLDLAEDALTGATVRAMQAAAQEHKILIVAPIYEIDSKSGKRFNTAVVIEKDGAILGIYRKCHIPEGENDAGSFHETFYYERSDGDLNNGSANISQNRYYPVFETSIGKLGIAICYDRHFPGVMKTLAEEGAELVFSPAVTFGKKSRAMWEMEFAVDAVRHNLFIGGSNRLGTEPPWTQEYFGASYFVGPNGRAQVVEAPTGLVIADLDLGELSDDDPSGWNFERDLRADIYNAPNASSEKSGTESDNASNNDSDRRADAVCLVSDRLYLRPLEHSDAAALYPALSSAETMRYWSSAPMTSVAEVANYLKWNVDGAGVQCFAITLRDNPGQAIGWVVLIDKSKDQAEIGFILCPEARGQGFGLEAAKRVMAHGFETRGLRRIAGDVDPDNQPSIRCLEALGMKREGHLRATWETHIGVRDSLIYSRLDSD
ncbi:MAG: GNAT family N-acetyltransferase [Kofleriaceae bacterium]|nr:GNAT family N-acetyltransferase [Kofleriaceae bacterium]